MYLGLLKEYGINPIQEEHAIKPDVPDFLKKGGKIKQKQKQTQKQVVNIKNIINVEKKERRRIKTNKPIAKPTPAPVQLPQYSTYNRFFQPSSEQNYKSVSMGNNIPNADNINAISNRVSNLILGRMRNNINNANSGLVIPTNFSSEQALTISNNTPTPRIEEVEEKKTPVEMNVRRPDEYDVEVKIPELESMGRDYINYPDNMNDRLTEGILTPIKQERIEDEEDELPEYSSSSEAIPFKDNILEDKERLNKMTVKQLYKEANQLRIQYTIYGADKKRKFISKEDLISEILNKRFGSPSFDLSTKK